MSEPLRVLHLIESLGVGGAERRLVQDVARLRRLPCEQVVGYLYPDDALRPELEALGIRVVSLGMRSARDGWRGSRALWRLLRSLRPHIVHTQLFGADVYGRVLGRLAGVPVILTTVHTSTYEPERRPYYSRKRRWVDMATGRWCADQLIAISERTKQALVREWGIAAERVVVIPNTVDPAPFLRPDATRAAQLRASWGAVNGSPVVLHVGRLIAEKDHVTLLRAFATAARRVPDLHLVLVGDGPLRAQIETVRRNLNLESRVHLLGTRADVPELLASSDVFVLPSRREGLPVALLEAMAAGKACIASRIGTIPDVLDETCGILVAPGAERELEQAIAELSRDPARRAELGRKAQTKILARYDATTATTTLGTLYAAHHTALMHQRRR